MVDPIWREKMGKISKKIKQSKSLITNILQSFSVYQTRRRKRSKEAYLKFFLKPNPITPSLILIRKKLRHIIIVEYLF